MPFEYGIKSRAKLNSCHPVLKEIAQDALALSPYDITIIHGKRDKEAQNALYAEGKSKLKFPNSRHNRTQDTSYDKPYSISDALDFAPWIDGQIHWDDSHIFAVIAGVFMAAASSRGVKLRWGGDWDSDGMTKDQTFMDWGHLEIAWE